MKRTYQPSVVRRKRTHGFLVRMRTRGGRAVIRARRPAAGPAFRFEVSSQFGFSREQRLRRKAQITSVLARGRSTGGGGMQLHSLPNIAVRAWRDCRPARMAPRRGSQPLPALGARDFRLLQHRLERRDYLVRARNPQRSEPSGDEIGKLFAAWCKTDGI